MPNKAPIKAASGVPGLDEILAGGFIKGALFLIEGNPGTGKTTLTLRFLLEGAAAGERNLYITLSETKDELLRGAASLAGPSAPTLKCSNCNRAPGARIAFSSSSASDSKQRGLLAATKNPP
jgi:predicted ATP-dependent serine protease